MLKEGWHHRVAGSRLEQDVLQVVSFWWPKAKAVRDEQRWLVYSLEEWQDKLPHLLSTGKKPSQRAIRLAIATLRAKGILITERHFHPYRECRGPVLWVRPNEVGIGRIIAATMPQRCRNRAGTYIQETSEQIADGQSLSGEPQEAVSETETDVAGADFLAKKKAGATIESALHTIEKMGGKKAVDHPFVSSPEKAHQCLRDACLAAGYPAPGSFNKMRGGQMKAMLRRMKEEGVGPQHVATLIFFVCSKWPEFISWSKDKFNVTVQGTAPNHASLTMFAVEAVGFWQSYATTSGTVQEKTSAGGSNLDEDL